MDALAAAASPATPEGLPIPHARSHASSEERYGSTAMAQKSRGSKRGISVVSYGAITRRTLGLVFLAITVLMWTLSNFLASTILADDSYLKPFFITYLNVSCFSIFLLGILFKRLWDNNWSLSRVIHGKNGTDVSSAMAREETETFLKPDRGLGRLPNSSSSTLESSMIQNGDLEGIQQITPVCPGLNVQETARLSFQFCMLWFMANYFMAIGLRYTTVASSTILASTSSIWTLLFGALNRVEIFTVKKLIGILTSFTGIVLISTVDLSGSTDKNRGSFPHKSPSDIAMGDALALASAVMYGVYSITVKKKVGDEGRVNIFIFFGFVGVFSMMLFWPGFVILHFTGVETFELPSTKRVWTIILSNSLTSVFSDVAWALTTLLTSPLLVTVGLSMSIPLSLIGQMLLNGQTSNVTYWVGAVIIVLSFILISRENIQDGEVVDLPLENNTEGDHHDDSAGGDRDGL